MDAVSGLFPSGFIRSTASSAMTRKVRVRRWGERRKFQPPNGARAGVFEARARTEGCRACTIAASDASVLSIGRAARQSELRSLASERVATATTRAPCPTRLCAPRRPRMTSASAWTAASEPACSFASSTKRFYCSRAPPPSTYRTRRRSNPPPPPPHYYEASGTLLCCSRSAVRRRRRQRSHHRRHLHLHRHLLQQQRHHHLHRRRRRQFQVKCACRSPCRPA